MSENRFSTILYCISVLVLCKNILKMLVFCLPSADINPRLCQFLNGLLLLQLNFDTLRPWPCSWKKTSFTVSSSPIHSYIWGTSYTIFKTTDTSRTDLIGYLDRNTYCFATMAAICVNLTPRHRNQFYFESIVPRSLRCLDCLPLTDITNFQEF